MLSPGGAPDSGSAPSGERERRGAVRRSLESAGFVRAALAERPRWLEPEQRARLGALAPTLQGLGPLYALLGRYLSTRVDQLQGDVARELSRIPDDAPPLGEAEVRDRLRSEIGGDGLAALTRLDPAPRVSGLLFQVHDGRLADGRVVSVKLLRSDVAEGPDRRVLPALAEYLSSLGLPLSRATRVLAEFEDTLSQLCDLAREAAVLEALSGLPDAAWPMQVARVVRPLSSARVLTVEPPPGRLLDWEPGATAGPDVSAARRAADLWLKLALDARLVAEHGLGPDVRLAAAGHLQLLGGSCREIPPEQAVLLFDYLVSAAREDAESSAGALRGLSEAGDDARPDDLRQQLNHVVPRRDGRFGPAPVGLPDLLLAHWLVLDRNGFRPRPGLLAFYRGVVCLREQAGPSLSESVLQESLQVMRVSSGARRIGEALDPALIGRGAEELMTALAGLPGRIERSGWLDRRPPERPGSSDAPVRERPLAARAVVGAWLLLTATLVVWLQRLPGALGSWSDAVEAGALGFAGGLLLWAAWRS